MFSAEGIQYSPEPLSFIHGFPSPLGIDPSHLVCANSNKVGIIILAGIKVIWILYHQIRNNPCLRIWPSKIGALKKVVAGPQFRHDDFFLLPE
jgi:hypothetical protein